MTYFDCPKAFLFFSRFSAILWKSKVAEQMGSCGSMPDYFFLII